MSLENFSLLSFEVELLLDEGLVRLVLPHVSLLQFFLCLLKLVGGLPKFLFQNHILLLRGQELSLDFEECFFELGELPLFLLVSS